MRQQLLDPAGRMRWQPFEHILEVRIGLMPVDAVECSRLLMAAALLPARSLLITACSRHCLLTGRRVGLWAKATGAAWPAVTPRQRPGARMPMGYLSRHASGCLSPWPVTSPYWVDPGSQVRHRFWPIKGHVTPRCLSASAQTQVLLI